jgi:hypothetical protein
MLRAFPVFFLKQITGKAVSTEVQSSLPLFCQWEIEIEYSRPAGKVNTKLCYSGSPGIGHSRTTVRVQGQITKYLT